MSIRTAEWRFFYPPGDDVFLFECRIIDWIATDSPCNDKGCFVSSASGIRSTMDTGLRRYDGV